MQNSIFSQIRKQKSALQVFVALMTNLMFFTQPLSYALNRSVPIFVSSSNYYSLNILGLNDNNVLPEIFADNLPSQSTVGTTKKVVVTVPMKSEETDGDVILSNEKQGIIGKSENLPIDELTDNIFSFDLKNDVKKDKDIYLEYELFGLADGSQVIKSVNDQFATGGLVLKTTKEWTKVREKLNPDDFQKGKNNISFTIWEQSKYQYMVRNLKLVYEDKTTATPIVFHQKEVKSFNGVIEVSGFIMDKTIQKVSILGKDYPVVNGIFEALVEEKQPNASLEVTYTAADGKAISNSVKVVQLLDKPTEVHKETKSLNTVRKVFTKAMKNSLEFAGARLVVDSLSLAENQNISISGLRYVDVPTLSPEMVNVTAQYSGYRMLPHGNLFGTPARIHLKYDQSKLPSGYTAKDIKTFYFDKDQKKWTALEKDTLLSSTEEIVSKTTHFTDFINGIIKVPESPETGSYTPTSIKDIKAADPTTGVVSIAPPTPNNMGTVNTSFPLKLPAGRSGMQPSLSVTYNSEGGNGWMGLGWDLSVPGVSLDTRWGAPRYDLAHETEIYSLSGMLTLLDGTEYTNPHRKADIVRTAERQFFPRIEGSYSKIIRHGDNPNNYWWEVTDKMGNKNFYGGYNGAVVNNAVTRTGDLTTGNIAYWGLCRTEDTNGNYVEYIYENNYAISLSGQPGEGGNEFYIKEINYTLHKTTAQNDFYKIEFIKDGDTYNGSVLYPYSNRADKQINAKNGLVQVTKNLLKEIKVGLFHTGDPIPVPIRSYHFDYSAPLFFKQKLIKIAEYDASGDLFYSNTMEYENKGDDGNDVTNNSLFSSQLTDLWDSSFSDGVHGSLLTGDLISNISNKFSNRGSALGTSKGSGVNGGLYVGVGFCCSGGLSFTAGVNFGYSTSSSKGLLAFMDINGDGLPDKVFRDGGGLKYRANLGLPDSTLGFGLPQSITGINEISKSTSSSFSVGAQASFGVFAGYTYNKSKNTTKVYFSDVNGDGLIDLVDAGTVKFNKTLPLTYLNPLFFDTNNGETLNPVGGGVISNDILTNIVLETKDQLRDENPQHDIVKRWVAPLDGTINIVGDAILEPRTPMLPDTFPSSTDEFYSDYDGVRVSIQQNHGSATPTIERNEVISPTFMGTGIINTAPMNMDKTLTVHKGDRIYFRVQSREEGAYDRVKWNPTITYTTGDDVDANGLAYYSSSAAGGFILSADAFVLIPKPGSATLTWNPSLNSIPAYGFSDNITFEVERGSINTTDGSYVPGPVTTVIYNQQTGGSITPADFGLAGPITVTENETFKFRVRTDSNVDWKLINWNPVFTLTPSATPTTTVDLYAVVDYQIYNKKINTVFSKFTINPSLPLTIKPVFKSNVIGGASSLPAGAYPIHMVAKNTSKRVLADLNIIVNKDSSGSITYTTTTGNAGINGIQLSANLTSTIFVEFYTSSLELANLGSFGSEPIKAVLCQAASASTAPTAFATPAGGCSTNNNIVSIDFDTLHDSGITCPNFYENQSLALPNPYLLKGTNYTLNVKLDSSNTAGQAAVWLDFDRDGAIDSGEFFNSGFLNHNHNFSIAIPTIVADGEVNVRVVGGAQVAYTTTDFDNNSFAATVRDYKINIVTPLPDYSTDIYCAVGNNEFGPNYRGWGHFAYHGGITIQRTPFNSDGTGNDPVLNGLGQPNILEWHGEDAGGLIVAIDESVLVPPTNNLNGCTTVACLQANNSSTASRTRFLILSPDKDPQNNYWLGSSADVTVEENYFSSSRLGVKNINTIFDEMPAPGTLSASCFFPQIGGVNIINKGEGHSTSFGGGFGALDVSMSFSDSFNWAEISYMDLNGDRYPDILTRDNVQFTNPLGALADTRNLGFGRVSTGNSHSEGHSASGTFVTAKTPGETSLEPVEGSNDPPGTITLKEVAITQPQVKSSIGVSLSDVTGYNREGLLWIDMNGDGLPDRVNASGGIRVRFNLGYAFGPEQVWSGSGLGSEDYSFSGGAGYSSSQNGYSAGITASASESFTRENFIDINGDGLTDLLIDGSGGNLSYLLNTGNGFIGAGSVATHISLNRGTGEGINGSFTIPINIPFFGLKIAIKINAGGEQSLTREEKSIQDINGDGFPDLLYTAEGGNSTNDGELHSILSNIGKTNLLKKVNTPTGGSWEVAYSREGSTFELAQNKYVLSTIALYDGFTADNNWGFDRSVTTVKYDNPHYDRREREFFGFEKITVEQHEGYNDYLDIYAITPPAIDFPDLYRYTEKEYHNDNYYLKGAIKKESLFDKNGTLWVENITSYGIYLPNIALNGTETIPATGGFNPTSNTFGTTFDADSVKFGSSVVSTATLNGGTISGNGYICTDLDHSSLFVTPLATIKHFTEGGSGDIYTATCMEDFDAFGNIKQYRDYGRQNTDAYVTKITYYPSTTFSTLDHAVACPEFIRVYKSDGSTLLRERKAIYYPTPVTTGTPGNGSEGELHQVITTLNGTQHATTSLEYDSYGNMTKITNEDSVNPDVSGSHYFKHYIYDSVLNTFPTRVDDAFGYHSTTEYNILFGSPVYTLDMNQQPMRTRIDDRGRPVEITGPYELFVEGVAGGAENAWTMRFEYENEIAVATSVNNFAIDQYGPVATDLFNGVIDGKDHFIAQTTGEASNAIHHALTRHFDPEYRNSPQSVATTNQILTSTLVDGLGKPLQVKKMAAIFDGSATSPATLNPDNDNNMVWLLNGKTKTDGFGRAMESYYPKTQPENFTGLTDATNGVIYTPANAFTYSTYNADDDTEEPTKATYDILDRNLTTQLPGETEKTTMVYAIDGTSFTTTATNELGQVQKNTTDVRGKTINTTQESVTGNITTDFEYNAIGELHKVTDVANNVTESLYDLAGRRIELHHPDSGIVQFVYDQAGNLIDRKTSNLINTGTQTIHYNYTYNRLNEIVYPQFPENNVKYFYGTAGNGDAANDNAVGRLWYEVEASGTQYFKYGRLGEVIKNRRSVAVAGDRVYWFQTDWTYDTWNRVKTIKYPDEELVTYRYNRGGELHAITSEINTVSQRDIISQLGYDRFGKRTYLRYGNGTETTYDYEAERRRLEKMKVSFNNTFYIPVSGSTIPVPDNRTFINNTYDYDILNNVTAIHNNTVDMPSNTQIGGRSWQAFTYDDLNRMTTAAGNFVGRNENGIGFNHNKYTLAMSYDSQHNIKTKTQIHETATSPSDSGVSGVWTQAEQTTYALDYKDYNTGSYNVGGYEYGQPHAPRKIVDQPVAPGCCDGANDPRVKTKTYEYDANGNQTKISEAICTAPEATIIKENLWDEENRLRAIDLNPEGSMVHPLAIYTYDNGGERIIKQNATSVTVFENGENVGNSIHSDYTLYPNGMLVARLAADGTGALTYTKHYYAGTQRVSSKIGTTSNLGRFLDEWTLQENSSGGAPINLVATSQDQLIKAQDGITHVYNAFGITPTPTFNPNTAFVPVPAFVHGAAETEHYFFHPDHLGSSNYITNVAGSVSQHMEYFAFGETFVEEHQNSINLPYKFNAKELDEESGLYYYGARYYDPRISIWVSVDPLKEKYPSWSPYVYTFNNPINFIDPTGMEGEENDSDGDPPCGTCGRSETKVQKATRIALVNLARAYNVKKFFQADNEESDEDVEASQLFYQWVMGTGKSERKFDENSTMGKQMLEAEEVVDGVDNAIQNFKDGKGNVQTIKRSLSEENELLYVKSFIDDLDDNPARAFHGSYSGTATIVGTETTTLGVYYDIYISLSDNMSAASGTRLPPILGGYEKGGSVFSGPNPYGPDGHFRTIKTNYSMNIRVFKYNTIGENISKAYDAITK